MLITTKKLKNINQTHLEILHRFRQADEIRVCDPEGNEERFQNIEVIDVTLDHRFFPDDCFSLNEIEAFWWEQLPDDLTVVFFGNDKYLTKEKIARHYLNENLSMALDPSKVDSDDLRSGLTYEFYKLERY
jgi:hypothetical protein